MISGRGHGTPGIVDNLRGFDELGDESSAARRPYIEAALGVVVSSWTLVSGNIWQATIQYDALTYDSTLRDIITVWTSLGGLTRVESISSLAAATYYTNSDVATRPSVPWDTDPRRATFDDGVNVWDNGGIDLLLYVWLPGGADPRAQTVIAGLGFYWSTVGDVQPSVNYVDLLGGIGTFESVASWTLASSGAGNTADQDFTTFKTGSASLRLKSTGAATGNATATPTAVITTAVAGAMYRLYGWYRTTDTGGAFAAGNVLAQLLVSDNATKVLYSDGRTADASGVVTLTPTGGEFRRFFFDFVAPGTSIKALAKLLVSSTATGGGQVNFDDVKIQRIWRFNYFEPRLPADGLPSLEVGCKDIFFGPKTLGLGNLKLTNADGALERLLAPLLTEAISAMCYIGGAFGNGQEVPRDNWFVAWPARLRNMKVNDQVVTFDADDMRSLIYDASMPLNTIGLAEYPNADLNDVGYPKPYRFNGYSYGHFFPKRVDKDASTGYGVYLYVDPAPMIAPLEYSVFSGTAPSFMGFCYSSRYFQNRSQQPLSPVMFNLQADLGTISMGPSTGLAAVLTDLIDPGLASATNDGVPLYFDFNIGAGALRASVGHNPCAGFAALLQVSMRSASGAADINVTYSETTHKFTVSKGAGTLQLLAGTGTSAATKAWAQLGFTNTADYTGALSYVGDTALFTDVDAQHDLLLVGRGYVDDASGTLTGTPNGYIATRAAICHFLIRQVFRFPTDFVDSASFIAGHAAEVTAFPSAPLSSGTTQGSYAAAFLHLDERVNFGELVSWLERGAFANLIFDLQAGRWSWKLYSPKAAIEEAFYDRDFLSFEMWRAPAENVFAAARLTYGQRPANKTWDTITSVADPGVSTKYGRSTVLDIKDVCVAAQTIGARTIVDRYARMAAANPRMARFRTRSKAAGRLTIGSIISITRARGLSSIPLDAVRFRVMSMAIDAVAGETTLTAVEDIDFWS